MVVSVRRVALVGLVTLLVISSCVLTAAAGGKKRTRRTQKKKGAKRAQEDASVAAVTHVYTLEHALDPSDPNAWTPRGSLTTDVQRLSKRATVAIKDAPTLVGKELDMFNELLARDGLYRVRARLQGSSVPFIMTSTKACLLHAANFVEFFQLHLDSTGKLMSLEFLFAEGVQCQVGAVASPSTRFVGKATVTTTQLVASVPSSAVGGSPLPGQRKLSNSAGGAAVSADAGSDEAQQAPPKSSWTKYMYYAIPIMLLMMLKGGPEPAAQQGGARAAGGSRR